MYYTKRLPYLIFIFAIVLMIPPHSAERLFSVPADVQPQIIKSRHQLPDARQTLSGNILQASAYTQSFPSVRAEGILVRDIKSDEIFYEKEGATQFPIASLTKMMTSLLFREMIPLEHEYRLFSEAKQTIPKISAIPKNSLISGESIIKLMMIESANDIAYLAAEKIGKEINFNKRLDLSFANSLSAAISSMNERALQLGMESTNFANPAGLDDGLHYSTPEDLFKLMRYIFDYEPMIWHVSQYPQESIQFRKDAGSSYQSIVIKNTDPLLAKYPRIIGSKTGFTDDAGQAVVLIYQLTSGKNIAIILLKSSDRFGDAEKIIQWLDKDSL